MFANKKLLTTMCPGDAYAHQATHTHSQPLFLRLCMILFLSLVGMGATWAQTTAVTFNNDVRYSQWIMDSRLPDFKGNTNQMGFPIYETDGTVKTNASTWKSTDTSKSAKNDYVAGLVAKAAIENAIYYGAFDWSKSYFRAVKWYTENIASIPTSGGSLDNLNPAKMHFGLYTAANSSNFSSIAGSVASNAQTQLGNALTGLAYYNNNYAFGKGSYTTTSVDGKDVTGGWFHKHSDYDNEMWCDGQYMGPALLAQLIANKSTLGLADNTVLDWDIVAKQFTITWNQLWNETDGLLYHAFTGDRTTSITNGWSLDDGVYHSKAYWGRAVGWYFLGLVDVLEQMPSGNANYATLKGYLNKLAAGVARYQSSNGVWYQVMDYENTLSGNYEEASCSAIFAAAYLKGTRLNLFTSNYQTVATNAYQGVISQFMKFDNTDKAKVHLVNSCASAGLGGSNKRSGERSYYIEGYAGGNGKDVTKITDYTEGKPLGAFIMAATEYEQLYQNGQNLKFTSDLAPAYTCNGTTDALKAEAMGGNTVPTYQWYKNSQAIPSATSSSYIPTESGNYYCVATGGNTIQTSTAAVTVAAAPVTGQDIVWDFENETASFFTVGTTYTYNSKNTTGYVLSYRANNTSDKIEHANSAVSVTNSTDCASVEETYSNQLYMNGTVSGSRSLSFTGISGDGYLTVVTGSAAGTTITLATTSGNSVTPVVGTVTEEGSTNKAFKSNLITGLDAGTTYYINFNAKTHVRAIIWTPAGSSEPTTYAINCGSPANGTVTSSVANAAEGASVTLTITPSAGYKLSSISATDASSNSVALSGSGTTRTFTMPASDVTVNASFVAMETSTATTVSGTTGSETTLTATPLASDATGQQTMTITKATGATYEIVAGSTTAANVSLDGTSLKYDAPAAGESKVITLRVTPEYGAYVDYTINVSTAAAAPAPEGEGTVIYQWNTIGTTTDGDGDGSNVKLDQNVKVNTNTTTVSAISFGSNYGYADGKYIQITPNLVGGFKTGDQLYITDVYSNDNAQSGVGIVVYDDQQQLLYTSTAINGKTESGNPEAEIFTLTGSTSCLYLGRTGGKTTYITELKVVRPAEPDPTPGHTVTFDGNGQTVATTALTQPTTGQAILLPAGYDSSEDVAAGSWNGTAQGNTDFVPEATGYYEVYNEGSVAAGNVLTQTISDFDNDATYEIVLSVGASYTSGRGFECLTGNNLTEAFAGSKSVNIPVFDRTQVTNETKNTVTFVLQPTDGSITFGLRNIAASGNWFIAKVESIKKVNTTNFNGWYTAATDGTKVGDAGDEYAPTGDITLYAQWKAIPTHLVKFNPAGGTATVMAGSTDITTEAINGTGAQVEEGTQVVITVTAPDGKGFKNWKNNLTGATTSNTYFDGTSYKYTVASLTEDVDLNVKFENKVEFDAPSDPAILFQTNVTSSDQLILAPSSSSTTTDLRNYATVVGAAATLHNGNSTSEAQMTYARQVNLGGSSASYMMVDLGEGNAFAAGDLITFGNNEQLKLSGTTSAGSIKTTSGVYTVQESDGIAGSRYLYIFKDGDQDAGGSAAFSSLLITRGELKKDITRLSPKGNTAKNTMYVGETNTPNIFIGPFEAEDADLSVSDFEITCEPAGVVTAEIRNATINNTIDANGYRTFTLNVNTVAVGSARVNINFKGNDQYNAKSDFIPYNIVAKRTVAFNGGDGATGTPADAYCGDGQTITAPEAGTMAKDGYEFAGWNTAADGSGTSYAAGDAISVNADVTLYAQWTPVGQQVLYSYAVTPSQTAVTDDEAVGGKFSSTKRAEADGSIKVDFNSQSSKNIKFSLNKPLAAGDVIKITMHQGGSSSANANTYGFGICSTTGGTPSAQLWIPAGSNQNVQVLTYTVTAENNSDLIGQSTLYLHRLNGTSLYFHEIEITRVAQAGTDATIKNVRMNNHNIPETVENETPTFAYSIGRLNENDGKLDVYVTPNDNGATIAIKDVEGNVVAFADGKFTANVGQNYTATVTATGGNTQDYAINVGMAIDRPAAADGKYKVENIFYYEGQQMSATGVDAWISLSAGTDSQLSFPTTVLNNGDYGYRIVNTMGENPAYNTTTGVPTAGTYYKFTPTQAGMLTVAVQLNANKQLIISNGAKIFVPGVDYQYELKSMDDGSAVALDNSGKASVNAVGTVTFSVSPKDYYIYAATSKLSLMGFELNELLKYTVIAEASTGGSVSINSGAITSGNEVDAGTPLTIVATPVTDYKFTGWTNTNGEIISTQSTYTVDALNADVNITAQFAATGIVTGHATFPIDVMKQFGAASADMTNTFYDTGNPTTTHVTLATTSSNVQAQNSSKGTKVRDTGSFTLTPASGMTIKSIELVTDQASRKIDCDADDTPTQDGSNWTYTMNADGTVTFTNNSGSNIYVTAINVTYEYHAGAEVKQYLGSFPANSSINDYVGAQYDMPALTVTDNGMKITEDYTVSYSSANESVAVVDAETNKIILVGAGATSIIATVTPNNGSILGSTATIAVTSKALEALEVTITDLTINNTDAEYDLPVPTVKVGDITLSANEYTVNYTEIDDTKNIVTANGAQLSINGSERNWTAGTASVRITITPTAAAKEKYHCVASASANFNITVVSAQSKRQPVIDMLDEITVNTGTDQAITFGVLYDGNNLNDIFDFSYVVTPGTATGATLKSSNKNVATVTTGSVAGVATITVTATPKKITNSDGEIEVDYADIYENATKTVTINIDALKMFQSVTVTPSSVSFATGNTQALTLTVKDENGDVLDEDEYTAIWSSNNPGVASVNAKGVVTGVSEGDAVLTVVVITEGYEGKNVTVDVQVTDPSMYKAVTGDGKYTTGTVLDTDNKNIEVTLGGWTFPEKVKAGDGNADAFGIASDEFNPGANLWKKGNTSGLKLTGFKCYADGVGDMKNPRNENGSNSQPESTVINDKLIVAQEGMETIDPMFNVPCAGSYLVFAPKTNGTITAYIYQNGAFESNSKSGATANTEFSYRPQRRVFIIDEAGNFVPSTAKLETTSGFKMPTYKGASSTAGIKKGDVNTNLNDYIWDLVGVTGAPALNGTDGKAPTAADVVSHFEGLESFDPTNVVNGVYQPSTVLDAALHNNISDLSQPGARGWVVLVPAPVIYTFNVQAGKTYHLYNFGSKIGLYGFKFVEDDVIVDNVELSEVDAAPKKTQAGHVAKVNMSDRTFKDGVWNAGVLPFSLNKQQVDAIFGNTYDKDNQNGTQIMYFDRVEDNKIVFVRHAYNTIVAGKPFIIKPAKGSDVTINTAEVAKFPYVTIEEEGTPALWGRNNDSGFMWRSSYSTVVGGIKQGDYYLNTSGDVSRRASASAVNIKGFRGWLQAQNNVASAKVLTVGFDSFFEEENVATDIEIVMDEDGNILELPKNGVIYNINGVAVSNDASKLYSLPSGLYIVNGKKYFVK